MKFVGIFDGALLLVKAISEKSKGTLTCKRCRRDDLYIDDFSRDKSRPSGRYPTCKECRKNYEKDRWDKLHPDKKRAHLNRHIEWKKKKRNKKRVRKSGKKYSRNISIKKKIERGDYGPERKIGE